jgi:hypothetical protein
MHIFSIRFAASIWQMKVSEAEGAVNPSTTPNLDIQVRI